MELDEWTDMRATHEVNPVVVVSIDGLAARAVSPERTPTICSLARAGAGCFTGSTVTPPATLSAHTSMLRSTPPAVHGIVGNEPQRLKHCAPSFLQAARNAGHTTGAFLSWQPLSDVIEPTATTHRTVIDGGYESNEDRVITSAASDQLVQDQRDVTFVYLIGPDLAGHAHGWDDPGYHAAVRSADAMLAEIVAAAGDRSSILVTTDHGGSGNDHATLDRDTMEIFIAARSPRLEAGRGWERFSLLDIAPTVASLAGFEPHPHWHGRSLIGTAVPLVDRIMTLLAELEHHSYGENVNMLDHSLQTAWQASAPPEATTPRCSPVCSMMSDICWVNQDRSDTPTTPPRPPDSCSRGFLLLSSNRSGCTSRQSDTSSPARLHTPARSAPLRSKPCNNKAGPCRQPR